jgi:YD repeat-containing protein
MALFFPFPSGSEDGGQVHVLSSYSDPQGRRYELDRNQGGDLQSITTPTGKWLHFKRDEKNRFRHIEDSEGHVVNYDYDSAGRLIRVSDSQGNTEVYRYDEKSQIVAVVDGQGHVQMEITYSPDGWITGQALADGRTFQYEYRRGKDGSLAQIRFTDPRGYVTLFDYVGQQYLQSLPSKSADPKQADAQPFLE